MKVFLVDPGLFSLPYDRQLAMALAEAGAEVTLIGRPLRAYEEAPNDFVLRPLFYRWAERLPSRLKPLARALKAAEHLWGMRALTRLVRRQRPDVVHFQWLVLPLLDRRFLRRLARLAPLVITVHNRVAYHGRPSSRLMLQGHAGALGCFDHFIALTQGIADQLLGCGTPRARVSLWPHPPLPLPRPPQPARPPTAPIEILQFGSLKPYKGIDVLVRAGLKLAVARDDFRITITGLSFMDLAPLRAEIAAAGAAERVRIEPRRQSDRELARLIAAADILVFAYREIDASGALASAVPFGRPIVASNLGVFAEAPVCNHVRLVPPESPDALAAVLEELIASPGARAALADRVLRLTSRMEGWREQAERCLDLYRQLPQRRSSL